MKNVLVLDGSNTGTGAHFAKRILQEQVGKDQTVTVLDLSVELKGALLCRENILNGEFYADSDRYIDLLRNADRIIAISSMCNFALSATMAAFVNKVTIRGKTFAYGPTGPYALLAEQFKDKEVIVLFTSGSPRTFLPEAVAHIPTTLVNVFQFIGFKNVRLFWGDGSNMPEMVGKSLDEKYEAMREKVIFD